MQELKLDVVLLAPSAVRRPAEVALEVGIRVDMLRAIRANK